MNYSHKFIFFVFCFIIKHIEPFQEIRSIKEVTQYLDPQQATLVIFDIDNTLLHPSTDLGSDQWFYYHVQKNMKNGMTKEEAIKEIAPLYFHINFIIDLIPTEPSLPDDLMQIKKNCEHIICLTARRPPLVERTVQQLHNNHLYFHIPELDDLHWVLQHPCFYTQGCLFCGSNCKGDVLSSFLEKINYKPDLIIFIDDKEAYLSAVANVAQQLNIAYIGLRYTGCDQRVKAFDAQQTEFALQEFLAQYPIA